MGGVVKRKPIRVFYSDLTNRFWATRSFKELGNGVIECTGEKFDVTNDIASIIDERGLMFDRLDDPAKVPMQ